MKHVRLTISADGREEEVHPMFALLTTAPYLDHVVGLHWNFSGDFLGFMVYLEGDEDRFRSELEGIGQVRDFEITPAGDDSFYAYVRDRTNEVSRQLFGTFTRGSLLLMPPVEYGRDGTVTFSLFGPADEIQAAIEGVPAPVTAEVNEVGSMAATPETIESSLSERQRAAVEAGVDVGYYDVPRSGSQEDVAEELGCSPSTAAEHLRKAEAKVLRSLFG